MAGDREPRGAVRQETEPCVLWQFAVCQEHEPNRGGSVRFAGNRAVSRTVVNTIRGLGSAEAVLVSRGVRLCSLVSRDRGVG